MTNQAPSGYLSHRALIDFILNKKSGTLVLNPYNRRLFFSEGNLIFASSENKQENFSEILVHIGVLDANKLRQLRENLRPGESLGRKLKEQDLVDSKQLAQALRQQITNIIDRCVAEKDLSCEIQENVLPGKLPRLKIQTLALITKSLTNLNDAELYASLPFDDPIAKSPHFDNLVETLQFPPSYNGLLRHLSEGESVYAEDLAREFGLKPRQIDGFLYVLNLLGMIHFQTAESLLEETITGLGLGELVPTGAGSAPTDKEDALADMLPDTQDLDDTLAGGKKRAEDSPEEGGKPFAMSFDEETRPVNQRFGDSDEPRFGGNYEDEEDLSEESFEPLEDEGDGDFREESFEPLEDEGNGDFREESFAEEDFESDFSDRGDGGHDLLDAHVENLKMQLEPLSSGHDSDETAAAAAPNLTDAFESPTSPQGYSAAFSDDDTLPVSFTDPDAATARDYDADLPMDGRSKVSFSPDRLVRSLNSAGRTDSGVIMPDAQDLEESGHGRRSSRKWPWVALGLAALLALGFFGFPYYRDYLPLDLGGQNPPSRAAVHSIQADPIPGGGGEAESLETADPDLNGAPQEDTGDSDFSEDLAQTPSGTPTDADGDYPEDSDLEAAEPETAAASFEASPPSQPAATRAAAAKDAAAETHPPLSGDDIQSRLEASLAKFTAENGVYTLAFMVACETATVEELFQHERSEEILLSPRHLGSGSDCYLLSWGIYPSRTEAQRDLALLPPQFIEGGETPWIAKVDPKP